MIDTTHNHPENQLNVRESRWLTSVPVATPAVALASDLVAIRKPSDVTNSEFLQAIFGREFKSALVAAFPDDPGNIEKDRRPICWSAKWFQAAGDLPPGTNQYFCISTFQPLEKTVAPATDGDVQPRVVLKAARRKSLFKSCRCIVLDDVREKLDVEIAARLPKPSWVLETSEGNEQWGYVLKTPETNRHLIDAVFDALIQSDLCPDSKDPGMVGVTRFVRLPSGWNTKSKCRTEEHPEGFKCRLTEWRPGQKVKLSEIVGALGAPWQSVVTSAQLKTQRAASQEAAGGEPLTDQEAAAHPGLQILTMAGLLRDRRPDGGFDVVCPWVDGHTGQDDSGTALWPRPDGTAGFRCHHGHCEDRTGAALMAWCQKQPGGKEILQEWRRSHAAAAFQDLSAGQAGDGSAGGDGDGAVGGVASSLPDGPLIFPIVNGQGKPLGVPENYFALFRHRRLAIRDNSMTLKSDLISYPKEFSIYVGSSNWPDHLITFFEGEATKVGLSRAYVAAALDLYSASARHHPIKTWLKGGKWDGRDRITEVFQCLELNRDTAEYAELYRVMFRKWMIAGVAFLYGYGGFTPRGSLVLVGSQGMGKTSFFKYLFPVGSFKDGLGLNPDNKDSVLQFLGHWCVELGEIESVFRKADISRLKAFLTESEMQVRAAYARKPATHRRQTLACGSCNLEQFNNDKTGSDRFWGISLWDVDLNSLQALVEEDGGEGRRQLWLQAKALYDQAGGSSGRAWDLTQEELRQSRLIAYHHTEVDDRVEDGLEAGFNWSTPEDRWQVMLPSRVMTLCGIQNPRRSDFQSLKFSLEKRGVTLKQHKMQLHKVGRKECRRGYLMPMPTSPSPENAFSTKDFIKDLTFL